ncbi:MAG TPA: undecaprenyl-diphosphate phosphatase [bacterium]
MIGAGPASAMVGPLEAVLLGCIEGLTEFLPVSSTGHLILAGELLRLRGDAVKSFEVVIQAGALLAVAGLYRARLASMWRGLLGRDPGGRALLAKLLLAFLPAAAAGLLLHRLIKAHLFDPGPVIAALAAGGAAMILVDRRAQPPRRPASLDAVTWRVALVIGAAQCLALWPGMSRAMVTIVAGILCGLPAATAAEFSFLLALPTLGAATAFDAVVSRDVLARDVGWAAMAFGLAAAALFAAAAIRGLIRYLSRHGLAAFGWYRLALAGVVWFVLVRE